MFDFWKKKDITKIGGLLKNLNMIAGAIFGVIAFIFFIGILLMKNLSFLIMGIIFLLPTLAFGYNFYVLNSVEKKLTTFKKYYCKHCEDDFIAREPRSKNQKDVYCPDCGTRITTPIEYVKGRKFEQKIKERFERSEGFKVISETPRYEDKNTHAKKYPDLRVQYFNSDKFFIEAKYRSEANGRKLSSIFPKDTQLKRFRDYKKDTGEKVYYFIGIGGEPEDPNEVYVVPVEHLIYHIKNNRDINYLKKKNYNIDLSKNTYYKIDKEKGKKILR